MDAHGQERHCSLWQFLHIAAKNYLRQISILGANKYEIRKKNDTTVMSIFKIDNAPARIFCFMTIVAV